MTTTTGPDGCQPPANRGARPSGARRALLAVLAVVAVVSGLVGAMSVPAAASTGGCRPVGGGPVSGGGPQRATVLVDTGTGPVWSACISFSGSVSGIEALELAAQAIPGLDPVYDVYVGQGRAVCQLLGVGNRPPNCLGQSVEYWSYFRNGTYARGGAGSVTVHDGDVEGWRWGRGTAPRAATRGSEAAAAPTPPPTTAPPTVPPPTAVASLPSQATPRGSGTAEGAGGSAGAPIGPPDTSPGTQVAPPADGSPGSSAASPNDPADLAGAPTSTAVGSASPGPTPGSGAGHEQAAGSADSGATGSVAASPASGRSGGSGLASALGFVAALLAVAVAGLVVHRRRVSV